HLAQPPRSLVRFAPVSNQPAVTRSVAPLKRLIDRDSIRALSPTQTSRARACQAARRRRPHTHRSISDAGWGVFLTILHAKAESAGREVIAVGPRNTSRQCPQCGHTSAENRLTQEKFHCVSCGHTAHADTVGALNVLRAGLVRREAQPA
ncbi:zinc ribbon domain-containing protein, partial [Actinacidiphila glaucinigra]|uniref:zinc ribbon domain-containing protein n=1 Tax=Actinacidiphila glaucinigra TaxID=235986 RepID=UPI003F4C3DB8